MADNHITTRLARKGWATIGKRSGSTADRLGTLVFVFTDLTNLRPILSVLFFVILLIATRAKNVGDHVRR